MKLVISNAHKGEVAAIRDVFDKLPRKNSEMIRDELKILFKTNNIDVARKIQNSIIQRYSDKYQKMTDCLDEGFEDAFQYCSIEETNYSRLKSTNMLERLNSEIKKERESDTDLSK